MVEFSESINIILFFKKQEQTYKCLICDSGKYKEMKSLYDDKNILVTTVDMLHDTLKSEKNFIYKYIFSDEVQCIYGEEDFKVLKNYMIVNDDYERNLKNIYNYLRTKELTNEEKLFYLVIFYQLLDGKMLYETINTNNDLNDFLNKNKKLVCNKCRFEKDIMNIYQTLYTPQIVMV